MPEFVEQRNLEIIGRRETDRGQCAMHEFIFGKNDECLRVIKDTIRSENTRMENRLNLLEEKMQGYITKWAMGMIILITSSLLSGMFGISLWQVNSLHDSMEEVTNRLIELNIKMTEVGVKQVGVIDYLETLQPEHKELMQHLERNR